MNKKNLHDLIERYLDDALSETERQQVAHLLATDAGFRTELELQRAIQHHLGNKGEMRLRNTLDTILWPSLPKDLQLVETPSAGHKSSGWLRLVGLLAILAIVGFALWQWWGNRKHAPAQPVPIQQPVQELAPESSPETIPSPTQQPPTQDSPKQPIAMANPVDFTPNPVLDARISGVRGHDGTQLELISPAAQSGFLLKDGHITLTFKGTVDTDSILAKESLRLFIYSNHPRDWENKQALFDLPFHFEPISETQYRVNFLQHLPISQPGLYYIVVGQERRPEDHGGYFILWVGKFTVK